MIMTGGFSLAATGSIQFRIFTSNANLPIEGATVVIRQQEPPGDLLGILVTDRSGQTTPLSLPAPDVSLGQSPENRLQPWSGLTVSIDHPEYERVILRGIQLFPGILTVQNVQLLPSRQPDTEQGSQQEYSFTPQPIWEGGT